MSSAPRFACEERPPFYPWERSLTAISLKPHPPAAGVGQQVEVGDVGRRIVFAAHLVHAQQRGERAPWPRRAGLRGVFRRGILACLGGRRGQGIETILE